MKRRYNMPFGAECRDDGSVRFRLWAPAARKVELVPRQPDGRCGFLSNRCEQGWFELSHRRGKPGSNISFASTVR